MAYIRGLADIRTAQMLKSFRASTNMTGLSQKLTDAGRVYLAECGRLNRVQNSKSK